VPVEEEEEVSVASTSKNVLFFVKFTCKYRNKGGRRGRGLTHAHKGPNRVANEIVNPTLILTPALLLLLLLLLLRTALTYISSCLKFDAGIHEKP
jgi:hypothetical protein